MTDLAFVNGYAHIVHDDEQYFDEVRTETFSVRYCGTDPELLQTIGNVKVTTNRNSRYRNHVTHEYEYTPFYRCTYDANDKRVDEIEIDNPEKYDVQESDLTDWEETI